MISKNSQHYKDYESYEDDPTGCPADTRVVFDHLKALRKNAHLRGAWDNMPTKDKDDLIDQWFLGFHGRVRFKSPSIDSFLGYHQSLKLYNRHLGWHDNDEEDTSICEGSMFDVHIAQEYLTEEEYEQYIRLVRLMDERIPKSIKSFINSQPKTKEEWKTYLDSITTQSKC